MQAKPNDSPSKRRNPASEEKTPLTAAELLPLFRLLTREPPKSHDFKTCPLCKEFGIDRI
jgi:hypothetical protein